jgi:hypothetical protein
MIMKLKEEARPTGAVEPVKKSPTFGTDKE